jgi:thiosulfate reductase cytochrome b subunit
LPSDSRPSEDIEATPTVIHRHSALVRITHWINALAVFFMVGSGLNIFNAHPMLYWGNRGSDLDRSVLPWLRIHPVSTPQGMRGMTEIGPFHFDTTGFLGWSQVNGQFSGRAWPAWLTIPSFQDLADGRHWHFLFAWVLVINGLLYLAWSLWRRHLQRDLWPTRADLRDIPHSISNHLRLRRATPEEASRYNVLQRLAYLGVLVLLALMVLTGLAMSPGFDAFAPLPQIFGGRQSARSIHFICMALIVLFIAVHLAMVVIAGPLNEIGSMITGRFRLPRVRSGWSRRKGAE